jgi:nucleoside-diphosphate-sugar epimerase
VHIADVKETWADISKAERLLGWQPRVSLDEGLRLCVEWYRANRDWVIDLKM